VTTPFFPAAEPCRRRVRCERAHAADITRWCSSCFEDYITDRIAGCDPMGGRLPDGRVVGGFADHAESRAVIAEAIAARAAVAAVLAAGWGEGGTRGPGPVGVVPAYEPGAIELAMVASLT
jgi:hypothetical protein